MVVFRITTAKWADKLTSSNQKARWNSTGRNILYTAESRALACLENVVHRNRDGLNVLFKTAVIEIPDEIQIKIITESELIEDWKSFDNYDYTRKIGDDWYDILETCILRVPSVVINKEFIYLLNTQHPDFKKIKIIEVEDFTFDLRIKE